MMTPMTIFAAVLALALGFVLGRYVFAPEAEGAPDAESEREKAGLRALLDERTRLLGDWERRFVQLQHDHNHAASRATELETELKNLREKTAGLEKQYTDTFSKLASDTLEKVTKQNNEQFLALAKENLGQAQTAAKGELEKREKAIENLVKPVNEMLEKYRTELAAVENSRKEAYGGLTEQVKSLVLNQDKLKNETSNLVNALRRPEVRGAWGEMALRNVAEMAGLTEHIDFQIQYPVKGADGQQFFLDMLVRIPGGRHVVIDSKVPFTSFKDAAASETPEDRADLLDQHSKQVSTHVKQLAAKDYSKLLETSPQFVVMFLPNEAFLYSAVERNPDLIQNALSQNIVIATPTILLALLRTVAYDRNLMRLAESAKKIGGLGKELYERLGKVATDISKAGLHLKRTVGAYNDAVSSMDSRLIVTARQFRDLGLGDLDELPQLKTIEDSVQEVVKSLPAPAPELKAVETDD